MTETLRTLRNRVAGLTGPDRETEDLVWDIVDHCRGGLPFSCTSSVDAVESLRRRLLPGWWVTATTWDDGAFVTVSAPGPEGSGQVFDPKRVYGGLAPTEPLARLLAILNALIHQAEGSAMTEAESYLGDGLYAEFDGWQFRLYTDRGPGLGVHEVYLEPAVLLRFLALVKEVTGQDSIAHLTSRD